MGSNSQSQNTETPEGTKSQEFSAPYLSCPYSLKFQNLDKSWAQLTKQNFIKYERPRPFDQIQKATQSHISKEFELLDDLFPWSTYKTKLSYPDLNIYCDVAPFAETAVMINFGNSKLPRQDLLKKCQPKNYINASYIKSAHQEEISDEKSPFGLIIATQGPQDFSVESFWDMVVENNVTNVVTLCHTIGARGQQWSHSDPDACKYFPVDDEPLDLGPYKIKKTNQINQEFYTKRGLQVTKDGQLHNLNHTHFQGWPDWQVPQEGSMAQFQDVVKQSADFVTQSYTKFIENPKDEPERLLVHCKAGIGRTGTTISVINSVILLNLQRDAQNIGLSPFSIVRRLREQRNCMVQTENQYHFIYEFLKEFEV